MLWRDHYRPKKISGKFLFPWAGFGFFPLFNAPGITPETGKGKRPVRGSPTEVLSIRELLCKDGNPAGGCPS